MLHGADQGTRSFNAEFNGRLSDEWSLHLEAVVFSNVDGMALADDARRDSFVELNLIYNF